MDALYRAHRSAGTTSIGVFRRRIELSDDAGVSARRSTRRWRRSTRRSSASRTTRSQAYSEVLALDPTSHVALDALDALFTRQAMWPELAENLETQLDLAETDEAQLALMLRLAALREREMGQVDDGHRGLPPGARARRR